jgi:hypothetical protein
VCGLAKIWKYDGNEGVGDDVNDALWRSDCTK